MAFRLRDADEFNRLISALASDVIFAHIHLTLIYDIWQASGKYEREFAESPTFWALTTQAHLEAGLGKLARAYDSHDKTLNLSTWLRTIQDNLHVFSTENFRQRLRNNPFVESLAKLDRIPDPTTLQADLASVSRDDPAVAKLAFLRDNALAHRSAKLVLQGRDPFRDQGFSVDDLHELAERAVEILNRYSSLFRASSFSAKPVGDLDFIGTLALVKKGLDCFEEEYRVEESKAGTRRGP